MSVIAEKLETLAEQDAVLAPLARLCALALRTAASPSGQALVSVLDAVPGDVVTPWLHGRTLVVDSGLLARLLDEAALLLSQSGIAEGEAVQLSLRSGALPALDVLRVGILASPNRAGELARSAGVSPGIVTTLGQIVALPVLSSAGRDANSAGRAGWRAGYCPFCAAWPALAEFRGLERDRWLRCGRCGSGWRYPHQQCPFCTNSDHRSLRYLAEEGKQDAQRVEVCERCRGYVKTFATLGAWSHGEILLQDLLSVELDLVAVERDYHRPEGLGFPLEVRIIARELVA